MVVILCGDERRQDRGANGDERGGQHGCCAVCVVGLKIGLLWYSHFAFVLRGSLIVNEVGQSELPVYIYLYIYMLQLYIS